MEKQQAIPLDRVDHAQWRKPDASEYVDSGRR